MNRYVIKKEINKQQQAVYKVVDEDTGKEISPNCGRDMADYHAYLVGYGRANQADQFLKDILDGGHPITDMRRAVEEHRMRNCIAA